jgi:hypothetical protein
MGYVPAGGVEMVIYLHSNVRPIVEPGAFEKFVGNSEAQRPDQKQGSPCSGAGPCNIASVLWYFRLEKENTEFFA